MVESRDRYEMKFIYSGGAFCNFNVNHFLHVECEYCLGIVITASIHSFVFQKSKQGGRGPPSEPMPVSCDQDINYEGEASGVTTPYDH